MTTSNDASAQDVHGRADALIVDASQSSGWIDFREVWRYRELIWIFAVRDITVRYRQTAVGIAWTVLQPLGLMFGFGVLKGMLAAKPVSGQVPDDVSMFCGLLLYQLFTGISGSATLSLVDNRLMVTKVYFPRVVLPLSCCLRPLLDFGIGMVVLVLLMVWHRVPPGIELMMMPVVVALTLVFSTALGLWLSALNGHYRDFGFIVPFVLQVGLFVSPVAYEAHVPGHWRWFYYLNPMASLLDAFRWTLLGTPLPGWTDMSISALSTLVILVSGAWYFHRVDRFMADNI